MKTDKVTLKRGSGKKVKLPCHTSKALVIGSGAAGLNAAAQLHARGVEDVVIVTEGLEMGTSINTGSDKQTYYKLAMCGTEADAPGIMAETYFAGGSMHGDLALVEAALSARAFLHLVQLGVPFPHDRYGQYVGYKTDHDPRQRATSIGPYTSREMCRALIRRVKALGIPVKEGRTAVSLATAEDGGVTRVVGAVVLNRKGRVELFRADHVVFAVGGPGGLYQTSVYPKAHLGGIGVALLAGARAQGLPESQYGMASTKFRWNVSGTYMQVVPRFISTEPDGRGDVREFLCDAFDDAGAMNSMVFLKGYQWPFDTRKMVGGSSLIDILVYIETVLKGRRVFLDFRSNPAAFDFKALSPEAFHYLEKSEALLGTPIARLRKMNPGAIELYKEHGIDLTKEPLEIAVCAQHNNGGLAADAWWESINVRGLYPIGEVNGSHGVYRPGGSALNAGQVGGFRAADRIAHADPKASTPAGKARRALEKAGMDALTRLRQPPASSWKKERMEMQRRMSRSGAHIRKLDDVRGAIEEAREQWHRLDASGWKADRPEDAAQLAHNRSLGFAQLVYLEAIRSALESGVGSRGSALAIASDGRPIHEKLDEGWRFIPEDERFREKVLETTAASDGTVRSEWVDRRPIPQEEGWFETVWAAYREGRVFDEERRTGS